MQKQRTCKLRTSLRRWHGPFYQTNRVEIKFEFSLISRSILKSIFLAHAFIFLVLPEGISQEVPSPTIKDQEQNPPKLNAAKITNTVVPGIISGIRKIYDKEKERYELLMSYLTPKTANTVSLADAQDLKINPDFITSLFFHSPSTYLLLLKNNSSSAAQECSFYSLLENGLLKTADEFSQNIVVDILFKNKSGMGKEGAIQTMSLPIGDTLEFIYKKNVQNNINCINNIPQKNMLKQLRHSTYKYLRLKNPAVNNIKNG